MLQPYQTMMQDQNVARLVAAILYKLGESSITITHDDMTGLPLGQIESEDDPTAKSVTYRFRQWPAEDQADLPLELAHTLPGSGTGRMVGKHPALGMPYAAPKLTPLSDHGGAALYAKAAQQAQAPWSRYQNDFDAMTDEQIADETKKAEAETEEHEGWLEAVAAWDAAGRPRTSRIARMTDAELILEYEDVCNEMDNTKNEDLVRATATLAEKAKEIEAEAKRRNLSLT